MLTTDATTYDSVRAVLGVTNRELSDTVLGDELFSLTLTKEMHTVGLSVLAGSDIVVDYMDNRVYPATQIVQDFVDSFRLFAAHAVAYRCLTAMPELSPSLISDSKATIKKDKGQAAAGVQGAYNEFRHGLQEAYAGFLGVAAPVTTPLTVMAVSSPTYDSVTNE